MIRIYKMLICVVLLMTALLSGCTQGSDNADNSGKVKSDSSSIASGSDTGSGLGAESGFEQSAGSASVSGSSAESSEAASSKNTSSANKSSSSTSSNSTVSVVDTVYINDNDYLTVSKGNLVNKYGQTVVLRGVNLGGWLIQECWMCPVIPSTGTEWGNLDTINAFKNQGFTDDQIQQLFDTYQDNWITEYDLDIIAGAGANCVRVPFWYRNFMKDESGTWINSNLDENPGFKRLDWIVREAGERGMYVILDMHGCPGGQSMNHCTGTVGKNALYSSQAYRATMKKLWVAITKRYKGNPAVAAFDIMNEPQNNDGFEKNVNYVSAWSSESWAQSNSVYREMIAAIREIDKDRVLSIEGIWRISNLPYPLEEGWTNMLYQLHLYDDTSTFKSLASHLASYAKKYDVAVYVGEFSNLDGVKICEDYGISWTTWTYKGSKGANGTWFMYYGYTTPVAPGYTDFNTALKCWGSALRTNSGNFSRASNVYNTIKNAAS